MMTGIMKAIRWGKEIGLSLDDVPVPDVISNNVLIKVAYGGVCGSDLHYIQKEFELPVEKPVILGHEISGSVVKIGDCVTTIKLGDRVVVNPNSYCNECNNCLCGRINYCPKGAIHTFVGYFRDGGWAEYIAVPKIQVFTIPESLPLDIAVLCEPIACIMRGFNMIGPFSSDSKLLILGCGIIGLLWASVFHHKGVSNITMTEPFCERRQLAEALPLGAKVCKPAELYEYFREKSVEQDGFHIIVDCSGAPKAIEEAFTYLRSGATLCMFGLCPAQSKINISPSEITMKEIRIVGTVLAPYTFQEAVSITTAMHENYLDYGKLGIKEYNLNHYQEAINELKKGSIPKAVFKLDENV